MYSQHYEIQEMVNQLLFHIFSPNTLFMSNILVKTRFFNSSMVLSSIIWPFLLHTPHTKQISWSLYEQRFLTWCPFSRPLPICLFFSIWEYLLLPLFIISWPTEPSRVLHHWLSCFNIFWQEFDYFLVLSYNMFRFCNVPSPNILNTNMCLFFL